MHRLILMRHAKSSWKDGSLGDHARPLNKRGRRDAAAMGRALADRGYTPQLALVSDAARTHETWAWMDEAFTPPARLVLCGELYHGRLDDIEAALAAHHRAEPTVLLLGHEPGWSEATWRLCGERVELRTAHAVVLEGERDGAMRLVEHLRPPAT